MQKLLPLLASLVLGSPLLAAGEVTATREGRQVVVRTGEKEILRYQAEPGELPEYHYGGFGFRGHGDWSGPGKCRYLSASGKTDRLELNTSREKWCWIGGPVDGATAGVTILGHPGNFRFPQPVRAHPDQPFFCFAPQQLGEMEISPGQKYISRYRLLVADGEPDAALGDAAWEAFAKP